MSNFTCEVCGKDIIDSPVGYVTGCEHYPMENVNDDPKAKNPETLHFVQQCFNHNNSGVQALRHYLSSQKDF